MQKFTDVSTLWYDETEYDVKNKLNYKAFKAGDIHILGNTRMRSNSEFFKSAQTVTEKEISATKKEVRAEYKNGISITEHFEFLGNVIRQYNTVSNNGDEKIALCQLSSANINISIDGLLDFMDPKRFTVHYCKASWCEETQWKKSTLRELGMAFSRPANEPSFISFSSLGSWTTQKYYPLVIIEDNEKGRCYFFENECGSNWEIQINKNVDCLQVDINTCNANNDGWHLNLMPNEEYTTTVAVYGMIYGDFEDAVKELIKYKRETSRVKWENGYAKLVYNNFMGATWGEPDKRLIEIIDAAADCGCEAFCIDAGWYREAGTVGFCGDYYANDKRFAPYTLEEVLGHMKKRGMLPGLWFEFEACTEECDGYKIENAMLKRNGEIIGGPRGIYDMTNEKVRKHLMDAVDRAYSIGMRFIKNDYNNTTGIGVGDTDYNENAKKQMRAIVSFIDEIKAKYPDIIIENCGSGGMRSDNFTLSHFDLQSTSDQENYLHNPSILMGSVACMPVEKAGAWTYPYFVECTDEEFYNPDQQKVKDMIIERNENSEVTIFNMVTGNMGAMYMSGMLNWANDKNYALIKEGTALYKKNREFLAKSYPIYPLGMKAIAESGIASFGLTNDDKSEIILAVWKIEDNNETFTIDLSKYTNKNAELEMIYPSKDVNCKYSFTKENGKLFLNLKGSKSMARLFKIINK